METTNVPRLGDLTRELFQKQMSLEFCKWLACSADSGGPTGGSQSYLMRFPNSPAAPMVRAELDRWGKKSAVAAGSTSDAAWAGVLAPSALKDGFVAIARSQSLLGRIAGLRRVPFNVRVPVQSTGANYQWVPELGPKPATALAFSNGPTLGPTKHAAIVALSRELIELSVAGMEGALEAELMGGLTSFTDRQFLDPSIAAVTGQNPASVTNAVTPITATSSYQDDVTALLAAFFADNPGAQNAVVITNAGNAAQIRSWNAGGGAGVEVLVSEAAGVNTVALDPGRIVVADAGVEIALSREASIQMSDSPTTPDASTVLVSAFQTNLVFFRVERLVNWAKTAATVVHYLAG